jgi:uncharacterized membrane protein
MNSTLRSVGIGWLAGMRTFAPLAWLARPNNAGVRNLLLFAAAFELVNDKRPSTADRTSPPQLIGRVVSGATTAYIDAERAERGRDQRIADVVTAAVAAFISTYAMFRLRKWADERLELPDRVVGAAEDAASQGLGRALARR